MFLKQIFKFFSIILFDSFSYFAGKFFGKNFVFKFISPKKTLEGYIGGIFFTNALFICYFIFASGTETVLKDGSILTTSQSKLVGAGLYLFYVLSFVAAVIMLFFGIKKSLNK